MIDAYARAQGGTPNWKPAHIYEGVSTASDAVAPAMRSWGMKKLKDENELLGEKGGPGPKRGGLDRTDPKAAAGDDGGGKGSKKGGRLAAAGAADGK